MKLLLIFVDSDHARDIERVLDEKGIPGYSEFPSVLGKGETGRKLGSRAFPGSSTLYVAAVSETHHSALVDGLRQLHQECCPDEGLKVYSLDAAELI